MLDWAEAAEIDELLGSSMDGTARPNSSDWRLIAAAKFARPCVGCGGRAVAGTATGLDLCEQCLKQARYLAGYYFRTKRTRERVQREEPPNR
jgi:hypothetical protein